MPDSTINTIITTTGTLLGALIGAYATLRARGPNPPPLLWMIIGAIIGGVLTGGASLMIFNTTAPSDSAFTGTWQGIDPYDGSTQTISLVQTGNKIVGTYNDTFTINIEPPGFFGKGSGTVFSETTAQVLFSLSRWDGTTTKFEFDLTLSNQENTLILSNCRWDGVIDTLGCPTVMEHK